jgi:hypothetical protein
MSSFIELLKNLGALAESRLQAEKLALEPLRLDVAKAQLSGSTYWPTYGLYSQVQLENTKHAHPSS